MAEIVLIRHGETEWSKSGQHTGRTDIPLTRNGRKRAAELEPMLRYRAFGLTLTSPMERARDTATLAGLTPDAIDDNLLEWDYGAWEGRTTPDIRVELGDPNWVVWDHPIPPGKTPGESADQVAARCRKVIARCLPVLNQGRDCPDRARAFVTYLHRSLVGSFLRQRSAVYVGGWRFIFFGIRTKPACHHRVESNPQLMTSRG